MDLDVAENGWNYQLEPQVCLYAAMDKIPNTIVSVKLIETYLNT